jgi:hypothetical protein
MSARVRIGFADNEAPIFAIEDMEPVDPAQPLRGQRPRAGAPAVGAILYREPTAPELIEFNREYFAALAEPNPKVGAVVSEVLYRFGKELITGARGVEFPEGADPVKTIVEHAPQYVIEVAERAFLVARSRIDMGKRASSPAAGSAASSAESTERPAST